MLDKDGAGFLNNILWQLSLLNIYLRCDILIIKDYPAALSCPTLSTRTGSCYCQLSSCQSVEIGIWCQATIVQQSSLDCHLSGLRAVTRIDGSAESQTVRHSGSDKDLLTESPADGQLDRQTSQRGESQINARVFFFLIVEIKLLGKSAKNQQIRRPDYQLARQLRSWFLFSTRI